MRYPADRRARTRHVKRRDRGTTSPVYAAIDLGTNNCRMLAARPMGRGIRVIDSFSRIVRLGEGTAISGRLEEAAIQRTLGALKVCAGKMRRLRVQQSRCVATEACRCAVNGDEFLARAKQETGLELDPIPPKEEARLILAGCETLLDPSYPRALIFDIGGGSTEILWVEILEGASSRLLDFLSVPRGVMTVAERYGCGVLSSDVYAEVVGAIDNDLVPIERLHGIAEEIAAGRVQMLGTSGTVTTLGGIHLALPRYDRSQVDGLEITFDSIFGLIERLTSLSIDDRAAIPCVGWQRADLMVAGCAILQAICRRWPIGRLRVGDRGIREGLLLEMMAADGVIPGPDGRFPASVLEPA